MPERTHPPNENRKPAITPRLTAVDTSESSPTTPQGQTDC